ncbi:hypothetical protein HYH02_009399 [Chlamydomonas schloesseri]|uniref:Uncharacterized protein n=1 Tax=Chlamydomonas schloesseri TaxID=2026947 RepID=A0A835TDW7_9CHLO|nr:hypothetical protein HYH02_009399 [Chlamydomonas schloesseri]|eukprot:KAG2443333.1 hypothetical protein HYH02_009399 [Chlamydomonas schloesseri]
MQGGSIEENWSDGGSYALGKVAERLVAVPRDGEVPVSMYTLIRAWVRNNPTLPLTTNLPPPLQRNKDSAAGGGEGAVADGGMAKEGASGDSEGRQQGLLSILPPQQGPTQLETETTPPMYPLDDFDAQEPEEALRKLKDHWVAVRHYHQAIRRAKLSRHRERLQVLLGEPSLLHHPGSQLGMQPLQSQHPALLGLGSQLTLQATGLGGGLAGLAQLGPGSGLLGPGFGGSSLQTGLGPAGVPQMQLGAPSQQGQQGVGDPQAALAAVLALAQGTAPLDSNASVGQAHIGASSGMDNLGVLAQSQQAGQQSQQQSQQLLGLPLVAPVANGGGNNSAMMNTGSMETLLALQQQLQQLPQAPQQSQAQQGVAGMGQSMQIEGGAAGGAGGAVTNAMDGANGS